MIAIKQAKFKTSSSNNIQENQIKITTNAAGNSIKPATDSSNAVVANRQISGISSSSNGSYNHNNNHNHNDDECPETPTLVRSTSNDQRNDSQISRNESNETRSETNNIDGATKTSSISSKLLQTHTPPSQPPTSSRPSTPHPSSASSPLSSSSSGPANVTAASMEPTTQALASHPTTATLSPHPTTASLITASTRIKQRQQKFLAAAAKSATSPHYTSNQDSMTSKQATRQRDTPAPCAAMSSETNNLPGISSRFTKGGAGKRYQVSMSILNGPCCRQTFNCCRFANQQMIDPEIVGAKKGVVSDSADDSCQQVVKDHDGTGTSDTRRDQSQMSCKKQTHHQAASKPIADASPMLVARTKVLSMATVISGASGNGLQKAKGRTNKASDEVASDNRSSRMSDHRRSISCASNANTVDCAELSSKPASLASVNVGDINRRVARLSGGNGDGDASYNIREHQQEMRRSGDNKDKDDHIDKYNRPDNQNYHHHYYNHNYQQYQQQHQPNRLHPKYQSAHQQSTQLLNKTVTQPQYHQPQHIMAHYKFHNDCQSSVLTYEQVERLDSVMNQVVPLYGRGNAPTLFVKLKELIRSVRYKLQHEHSIEIRDVRLNGGTASYVLAPENSHYNDLDLVFVTDLSDEGRFDVIRDVVLDCLMEFYPDRHGIRPNDQFDIKQNLSSELLAEDTNAKNHQNSREQQTEPIVDDDLEEASGQSLRSERSSSFESDNLNITTELDEDSSDDEDNIIVRIDDDDARKSKISTIQNRDVTDTKLCENIDRTLTNEQVDNPKLPANNSLDGMNCGGISATERKSVEQVVDGQSNPLHGFHYQSNQMPPNNCAIKEAYIHKMVKVNDDDRWSLISLGVQQSETNNYNQQQLSSSTQTTHNDARVAASGTEDSDTSACCDLSLLTYQPRNHAQRQKQFPNSIELKFVDRMRRKFEFSVDSFQIILDSLIQFYDYAPQSTITIQRKSSKLQTVPTIFDPRHLSNRMVCANYDRTHKYLFYRKASDDGLICSNGENGRSAHLFNLNLGKKNQHERHQRVSETLNSTRSFCELPLEPGSSLSNSSVASSSGCSSSSSVVSSSSSSLSCDDDPDVLCCDPENAPSSCAAISENFYPTVIGRSEYGNFKEALYHLEKKLIATRSPEEIRGGGLLKYCNLLVKNYKPTNVYQIRTLERYMCSRFFIDFSDLNQQRAKLESYLANHFSDDSLQKYDYLTILYNVVQRSTVCLMNHELRLTLSMIRELAYNLNEQQAKQHQYVAQ